jgi:hypothetical protein
MDRQYEQSAAIYQDPPPTYSDAIGDGMNYPEVVPAQWTSTMMTTTTTVSSSSPRHLAKPVAIPQTLNMMGSPFLRAYPPSLEAYDIPASTFLAFLDTLNRVSVKSPPLQVLGTVGNIVSFIPEPTAMIVGSSISAAATLSAGALQHGRTEMELRRANADVFRPKGLKVEVARIDAIAKLTGMPILDSKGKIDKTARLLNPILNDDDNTSVSGQQRRLDTMQPWIAHLDMAPLTASDNQQEPEQPQSSLRKLSGRISESDRRRGEQRLVKKRGQAEAEFLEESQKLERDLQKEMAKLDRDLDKDLRKLDRDVGKIQLSDKPNKADREMAKVECERRKIVDKYEKEKRKEEKDFAKELKKIEKDRVHDDKEEKSMRKILWLIIRDQDAPSGDGPNPDMPTP